MSAEEQKPSESRTQKSRLENLEAWSKVLAAIAIPVVIAIGGWIIQDTISRQGTNKDYVNLALQILQKKPDTEEDSKMRSWAVDLINASSPVKFDPDTTRLLKAGAINLTALNAALSTAQSGYGFAVSPDSTLLAIGGRDMLIRVFDLHSLRELIAIRGHTAPIYALAFSPDGDALIIRKRR
jgi:WD40 repeat protein